MADPDYFTLAEFRALPDMESADEGKVLAIAAYFTAIVERETGRCFVPRTITETLSGGWASAIVLKRADVVSVTTLIVDGSSVGTGTVAAGAGVLRYLDGTRWSNAAPDNVTVTYSAGDAAPPADIKDAVMWATRDRLLAQGDQNDVDIRKTSITTEYGTTSYVLPGENRPTGYPDLDALIASYKRSAPAYGFA